MSIRIRGYFMELGQLLIDIGISESSLSGIENKLKERAAKISDFVLTPRVDDGQLTKLNAHLDLKISHLKSVNSYFSNNKITPQVDLSQVNTLKASLQEIAGLQTKIINNNRLVSTGQSSSSVSIKGTTTSSSSSQSSDSSEAQKKATENLTNKLLVSLNKSIVQGFNKSINNFNPLSELTKGIFERFGHNLTDDLTKGTKNALKDLFDIDLSRMVEQTIKGQSTSRKQSTKTQTSSAPQNENLKNELLLPIPMQLEKEKILQSIEQVKSINNIVKSVTTKNFTKAVDQSLDLIKREIKQEKPNLTTASVAFTGIKESFKSAYAAMQRALVAGNMSLAESYAKTIVSTSSKAYADIDQIVKSVGSQGFSTDFGSPLKTMAGSTKGVLTARYVNASKRTLSQIGNKADRDQFTQVGTDVVKGLTLGLGSASGVTREASNISLTVLNAMRRTLGIQSPSKKAFEIGKLVIEGLKLGIQGDLGGVKNIASQITTQILPDKETVRRKVGAVLPNLLPETEAQKKAKEANAQASIRKFSSDITSMTLTPGGGGNDFFEGLFHKVKGLGVGAIAKGYPGLKPEEHENLGRQAAVFGITAGAGLTNQYGAILGALASPLVIPAAPTILAAKVAKNILTPIVTQVYSALQNTSPILLKLSNLAGSEAGGKRELGYVTGVSNKYGADLKGSADSFASISFATKGTKLEGEDTKKIFEGISAATKFVGADASKASLIFQAFGQMISKGKVSMEELRLQLAESFPPAMQVFAKAIGKSVPELTDLISKGAILSEDILPKVADVLLNDFSKGTSSAAASFVQASNRIQNAFFDFQLKISESFGRMVTGVINLGAGIFEGINSKIHGLSKAFNLIAVSIVATTAAGFTAILGHEAIASRLKYFQTALTVSFGKATSLFTPFIAGTFIDLIDDFFGVKNSATDNVAKGITNFITGIFTGIDNIAREFNKQDKGLFSVGLTDQDSSLIDGMKDSLAQLFSVVPKGVVEMTALILMFQQCALLAGAYVVPQITAITNVLKSMGTSVLNAVANFGNMRDSMKDFFPLVFAQAKNLAGVLLNLGLNAAGALAVMSLAQSDFSNPLQKSFDQARSSIKGSLDAISSDLNKLKLDAEGVGKSLKEAIRLPSKGLELNLFKVLGMSEDSFKSDDLVRKFNQSGFVKGATRFKDFLEEKTLPVEQRSKTIREQRAKEAENLGLSGYFNKDDKYTTLAQDQLLNNARELSKQRKDLETRLSAISLSPSTIGNFQTGGTKKNIEDLRNIDKEIYNLSAKRSQISLGTDTQGFNDPKTKKDLAAIDAQINVLTEKRKVQGKTLSNIFGSVGDIKSQLTAQLKAIDDADIPASAKNALKEYVQPQIAEIDRVVKYLKDNKLYDLVQPLASIWQEVTDKLTTAENSFTRLQKVVKLGSLNAQTQITLNNPDAEGTRQNLLDSENLGNLNNQESQLAGILKTRTEALQKLLTISNVESAPNSKDDIKALRENIDKDKESLAETRLQIAQARSSIVAKLRDQIKQVNEFYSNLNRQVELQAIESQKINISLDASRQQTRLRQALTGGYDTIVSQFIESVISSIDQSTSSSQAALDAQTQLIQNRQQLQDNLKAGNDLAKSLPGYNAANRPSGLAKKYINESSLINPLRSSFNNFTNELPDKELIKPVQTFSNSAVNEAKTVLTQTSNQTNAIKQQVAQSKEDVNVLTQAGIVFSAVVKSWLDDLKSIPQILSGWLKNVGDFFNGLDIEKSVNDSLNSAVSNTNSVLNDFTVQANSKINELLTSASGLGSTVGNIFTESIPEIASQIGSNVSQGIDQGISSLQNAAQSVADAFLSINSQSVGELVNSIQSSVSIGLEQVLSSFNQSVQGVVSLFSGGLDTTINNTNTTLNNIANTLNKGINDTINNFSNGINTGINNFVSGIGNAVNSILDAIKNFGNTIASFNPQSIAQGAGNAAVGVGDAMYNSLGAVGNWLGTTLGIGKTKGYTLIDSNDSHNIRGFDDTTVHHANRNRPEVGRQYSTKFNGKKEEVDYDPKTGLARIKKDVVLQINGSDNVGVPSPVAGYARTNKSYGQVNIYDKPEGGQIIARILHLADFAIKSGEYVKYGQKLGTQGGVGGDGTKAYGTHLHVESTLDVLRKYFADLKTGDFSQGVAVGAIKAVNSASRPVQTSNMVDPRQNMVDTRRPSGSGSMSNMTKYLHQIGYAESEFQNLPGNSAGATGYFQFTPEVTRIANSYGVNPRSSNIQEAANATAVFIRRYHPAAFKAIEAGDFKRANYELGQKTLEWTSLPGSRESNWGKNSTFSIDKLARFESGNFSPRFNVPGNATPIKGVTGNYQLTAGTTIQQPIATTQRANNIVPTQSLGSYQLQQGVSAGTTQAQQLARQRENQIREQEKARIAKDRENKRIADEKAVRQLREAGRQLQIDARNDKKQNRDAQFATIFNPTTAQRNAKAEEDIKYEVSDMLESAQHKLENVRANRVQAETSLKGTDLPDFARKALESQLPTYRASEKALEEHIKQIKALQNQRLAFQKQTADREEALRSREQSFSERQKDVDTLQEQINKLTTLKASSPNNQAVLDLPNLQRTLDLKKEQLATDRDIATLNDELFSHKIDKPSFDRQLENINQRSQAAKDSIQLRSTQALTQQDIDRIKRDLDNRKSEQENISSSANISLQSLLDRPAFTKPEDLIAARNRVFQSDTNAENISYESKRLEYKQLEASDNSQPERIKKLYDDLDKLHIANLDQIKLKHEQLLAMDKSDRTKLDIEARSQVNEQLNKINSARVADLERLISKTSGVDLSQTLKQSFLRQSTYQNQVNSQRQTYLEESNKIDDLEINKKRTPEQIKELRENLEALNKITLDGFKNTLEDALNTDAINRFQKRIDQVTNLQYLESSSLDARKAKIAQNVSRGGNPFVNNRSQREVGAVEEDRRYILEGLEVDKKIAELKASGQSVPDEKVKSIKENLFQIHSINLDNLNDQFKTFGGTIDEIAKTGLQGLSQSIADVITEGGDLGSVFQNLFKTIANGFIKNGLDSLIGGLTNSLFGGQKKSSGILGDGLLGGIGDIFGGGGGILSILGFREGGNVPAVSGGSLRNTTTQIGDALRKEGTNAVLAALTPGERVLTTDENRIYNMIYPTGIKNNYKTMNFNDGGNVGVMSRQVTNKFNSMGTNQNNPTINIQNDSKDNYSGNEKQSVKLIRAVVIAELQRQNSPGGVNRR